VQGTVLDQSGNIIHRFGGLWHEGIFCDTLPTPKCIWKPSESPIISKITRWEVLCKGKLNNGPHLWKALTSINPSVTFVQQLTWKPSVIPQIPSRRIPSYIMASPHSPWSWMNSPQNWSLSCHLPTAACAQTKGQKSFQFREFSANCWETTCRV